MLNSKFNKEEVTLEVTKYLEDVDFNDLKLSKSGKSYSVSYDKLEFEHKGVIIKGSLTLYAPKDAYEDYKHLRDKGKEQASGTNSGITDLEYQEFLEFKKWKASMGK